MFCITLTLYFSLGFFYSKKKIFCIFHIDCNKHIACHASSKLIYFNKFFQMSFMFYNFFFVNLDILEEVFSKNPLLFHVRDQKRKTPLHLATASNYIEGIQFILTKFKQQALL